jgi:catechol 2,3-dioxygenase-like lactoylglutathione lyase family enzyme
MPVLELNHYFIRARDLEVSRRFYCEGLGFEVMPRPEFGFAGYWLGAGGKVHVHMGLDGAPEAEPYYLGTTAASARDNAGVIDHIAFLASDPEAFWERLDALALEAHGRHFPAIPLYQIFVSDPDGLAIELNFPGVTAPPQRQPDQRSVNRR